MGYIFSHPDYLCLIQALLLNNCEKQKKIFNVSMFPHQIVKMI